MFALATLSRMPFDRTNKWHSLYNAQRRSSATISLFLQARPQSSTKEFLNSSDVSEWSEMQIQEVSNGKNKKPGTCSDLGAYGCGVGINCWHPPSRLSLNSITNSGLIKALQNTVAMVYSELNFKGIQFALDCSLVSFNLTTNAKRYSYLNV